MMKTAQLSLVCAGALLLTPGCARSSFGDTKYVGEVTLGGGLPCPNATLASLPVTVNRASRISGSGSGVYHQNGTNLNVISLHLELADMTGTTVGVSNFVPVTAPYGGPGAPTNGNAFGAVAGVLQAGSDSYKAAVGSLTPFVAQPGSYTLKMIAEPASSPCSGQSYFGWISLSYILLSTSP